jgi:integrase
VNRFTGTIVRFFKWCVENELVPPSVHHGLRAVSGLRRGRSEARETRPIRPAPDALVDAIERHVPAQIRAMIQLQRLTGMRPGEACIMRSGDIDVSGRVWIYTPREHKTEHLDRQRQVYLGPAAQNVIKPWLRTDLEGYLFQPKEAMKALAEERRRNRRTSMTPSQQARTRLAKPEKTPGDCYTAGSYRQAVTAGCARAFPHPTISKIKRKDRTVEQWKELKEWNREHSFHPNQLRHNAATRLRR